MSGRWPASTLAIVLKATPTSLAVRRRLQPSFCRRFRSMGPRRAGSIIGAPFLDRCTEDGTLDVSDRWHSAVPGVDPPRASVESNRATWRTGSGGPADSGGRGPGLVLDDPAPRIPLERRDHY